MTSWKRVPQAAYHPPFQVAYHFMPISHKVVKLANIGIRQSNYIRDNCSTQNCFALNLQLPIFTTYENQALVLLQYFLLI